MALSRLQPQKSQQWRAGGGGQDPADSGLAFFSLSIKLILSGQQGPTGCLLVTVDLLGEGADEQQQAAPRPSPRLRQGLQRHRRRGGGLSCPASGRLWCPPWLGSHTSAQKLLRKVLFTAPSPGALAWKGASRDVRGTQQGREGFLPGGLSPAGFGLVYLLHHSFDPSPCSDTTGSLTH